MAKKLVLLARTAEPDSFVMYCVAYSCSYVGETNAVQDPICPVCGLRTLTVWKSRV